MTNIELYEALKRSIDADAARMIAEVIPPAAEVATKADIAELKLEIVGVEGMIVGLEGSLKGYIDSRLLRYTLAFFIPMWASMAGLFGVLLAKF